MKIKIQIENKHATVVDTPVIVCGNSDYSVEFIFDDEWATADVKTARFVYVRGGLVRYEDVVFSGNTAPVPVLANIKEVSVGVFAGDLLTTTPAKIPCEPSIRCGTGAPAEPTPAQYDQIMELLRACLVGLEPGEGENATQKIGSHALADDTTAIGANTVAGCLGYYYSAIDIPRKHIYLSKEQVVPVLNASALSGVTDGAFETYCSYAFREEGLFGFTMGVFSEADADGYLDVDFVKVETMYSDWEGFNTDFSDVSDLNAFEAKDSGITVQDGYVHIPRRSTAATVLGYALPMAEPQKTVNFQLRVRTNSPNVFMALCGNGFTSKIIFGTNTGGNLYVKNSNYIIANNFADEEWHTVNIVAKMGKRTVSVWADQKQIDVSEFYDASFEAPAYTVGDTFSLVNGSHYDYIAKITAIDGNRISYEGDIGFKSISADSGHDAYAFTVPENPLVGVIPFGEGAFASGENAIASNRSSFSAGRNTYALGDYAAAIGRDVIALYCALGFGKDVLSRAMYGMVGGLDSESLREAIVSITYGNGLINPNAFSALFGKFNEISEGLLFALGNGKSDDERSNAHTVDFDGNAWYAGELRVGDGHDKVVTQKELDAILSRLDALEIKTT